MRKDNNNILLTGANGFLGKILYKELFNRQYELISLARNHADIIANLEKNIDLSNLDIDIDVVIHAAGKAHMVPKTEAERQAFFDVNFQGTKNLCAALEALPQLPRAFIFISTVAVYGLNVGVEITEDCPLSGKTPYAKSKILAEQWLQEWCKKKGVTLSILRLPLVAGPLPPGNLGAMIRGIKVGKYLSIGLANAKKSIIWAADIASIVPNLAEKGGIYNLTDGVHPSFGELELAISKTVGKSRPLKTPLWLAKILGFAGDLLGSDFPINSEKIKKITSTLTFDDSRARKLLAWNPSKVLDKIQEIL